jgi:hypothetical protein
MSDCFEHAGNCCAEWCEHCQMAEAAEGRAAEYVRKYRTWHTEAPTVPGWYWAANPSTATPPVVVEVCHGAGCFWALMPGEYSSVELSYFTHWLGPIDEPGAP